jgi:hypothetical protein
MDLPLSEASARIGLTERELAGAGELSAPFFSGDSPFDRFLMETATP